MNIHAQLPTASDPSIAWCPDRDSRDNVIARRNVLAALWAGRLMGLSGAAMTAYAVNVHLADHQTSGDADVVAKIAADFRRKGLPIPEHVIRDKLCGFHREALAQLGHTD